MSIEYDVGLATTIKFIVESNCMLAQWLMSFRNSCQQFSNNWG
ncbi:hypothetical protein VCRA2119O48_130062 [Vibrio crassostreae]|nr:hypothetical protein VCRA2119O48_130062 [Vibrio crassostreae]